MDKKFSRIYNWDYSNRMKDLVSQSSIIKQEVFKNTVMGNHLDYVKIKTYLNFINDFLRFWEGYAEDTQTKMAKAKGREYVRTIKYQDIKDFIYSNYDYAAIIPFIDNLYKEFETNGMNKNDIKDYFVTTVKKAFDGLPGSIGGLVDYASDNNSILRDSTFVTDKTEAKLFDSVKNYRKMFQSSDRIMLFKASQKAIDFITKSNVIIMKSNVQTFINMINCAIDMITYSLIAYATRIFIICDYGYAFITADYSDHKVMAVEESVEEEPKISDTVPYQEVDILANTDETIFKKTENCKNAYDVINEFITIIGANSKDIHLEYGYHESSGKLKENNKFTEKLKGIGNLIYNLVSDWRFVDLNTSRLSSAIEETNQKLKSILYNDKQGNEVMSSPLQEFLHIIRGVGSDVSTLPGMKEVSFDLAKTFVYFNQSFLSYIDRVNSSIKYDLKTINTNINDDRNFTECIRLFNELYSVTMVAILHRFKDLEILYNNLTRKEYEKIDKMVSIDTTEMTPNIIKSVPDTLRMPLNILNLYDLPTFESLNMYTEYLRSLPELKGDMYLSEATGLAGIIDKLIAAITGRWNALVNWYNNKSVKTAMKWVEDHQKELTEMDLTNSVGMKIYPYPSFKGKDLNLEKGYKNLMTNIKSFNPDDKNFNSEKFIASLYPNDAVRKWFDDKQGDQKYYTWIISNCSENEVTGETPQDITLSEQNIKNVMKECLDNCINLNKIFSTLSSQKGALDQEVEKIKRAAVKATSSSNTQQASVGAVENKDQDKQKQGEENKAENNNIETPSNDLTTTITQINLAIVRLWNPIPRMIAKVITDQYQHLKSAYEASKTSKE